MGNEVVLGAKKLEGKSSHSLQPFVAIEDGD